MENGGEPEPSSGVAIAGCRGLVYECTEIGDDLAIVMTTDHVVADLLAHGRSRWSEKEVHLLEGLVEPIPQHQLPLTGDGRLFGCHDLGVVQSLSDIVSVRFAGESKFAVHIGDLCGDCIPDLTGDGHFRHRDVGDLMSQISYRDCCLFELDCDLTMKGASSTHGWGIPNRRPVGSCSGVSSSDITRYAISMLSIESARGPTVSTDETRGNTPSSGIRPWVTLSPNAPQSAAGTRTEPPVSVPMAIGVMPAATQPPIPRKSHRATWLCPKGSGPVRSADSLKRSQKRTREARFGQ